MKERSCHRCGLVLYEEEKACPSCGARVRNPELRWFLLFLGFFILFFLLLTAR